MFHSLTPPPSPRFGLASYMNSLLVGGGGDGGDIKGLQSSIAVILLILRLCSLSLSVLLIGMKFPI